MTDPGGRREGSDPALDDTLTADASRPERDPTLEPGSVVGRYEVERTIGMGGMGVVYAARDPELQRPVALKLLRAAGDDDAESSSMARRLLREARAMAQLSHPNVISVYDVGRHRGGVFIAMELVEGETLRSWGRRQRPWQDALAVYRQAGEGLAAAHEVGLIHRDFKPDNAFLGRDGRVRVLDFGLVRGADEEAPDPDREPHDPKTPSSPLGLTLTRTGAAIGTPLYMPPEQHLAERSDERSDQFSFCVALYEAVYGEHPFLTDGAELRGRVIRGERNPVPSDRDVPAWLRDAILRGLSPARDDRFPSMRALLDAITPPKRWSRGWLLAGGALAAAAAITALLLATSGGAGEEPKPAREPRPTERQITFTGSAFAPALSPDGNSLYYSTAGSVIRRDLESGAEQTVYDGDKVSRIRSIPGGGLLLTVAGWDGPRAIVLGADDQPRPLSLPSTEHCMRSHSEGAMLSRDTRSILVRKLLNPGVERIPVRIPQGQLTHLECGEHRFFVATVSGNRSEVYAIYDDDRKPRRLFQHPGAIRAIRWAAEAETLYVLPDDHSGALQAIRLSRDGTPGPPRAVPGATNVGESFAVSADGRLFVFPRERTASDLFQFSMADNAPPARRLTDSATRKYGGVVSPDGRTAAYAVAAGAESAIFTVPVAGGKPRRLVGARFDRTELAWSPDGTRLAYVAEHDGTLRIWTVAADGSDARPFADSETSIGGFDLTWAPGSFIVYQRPGNRNFHLLDPATGTERPLLRDESRGLAFRPRTSPSGDSVAVMRVGPETAGLYRIDLEPYAELQLGLQRHFPAGWTPDGSRVIAFDYKDQIIRTYDASGFGAATELGKPPQFGYALDVRPIPTGDGFVVNLIQSRGDLWQLDLAPAGD